MTTPAQDAPLVFPSVAFRPLRLFIVCVALTAIAVAAAWFTGHPFFGVFFGVGLVLGLLNAILVKRAVEAREGGWLLASDNPYAEGPSGVADVEARVLLRYWPLRRRS